MIRGQELLALIALTEYAVPHMEAKRSATLLSGLLLLMIFVGWAQKSDTTRPTCPAVSDSMLQSMLVPTAWVKADWNANTSRWDIDCSQIDAIANMPALFPHNAMTNQVYNAIRNQANALPSRGRPLSNSNYVNTNPYRPGPDTNVYTGPNATVSNVAANSAVKPAPKSKPRP